MTGTWWSSEEEFRFFESFCVMILCGLALLFDYLKTALQAWVTEHDHAHKYTDVAAFYAALFSRASSELMVLGFLAFTVWTTSRTGGFDAIVGALPTGSNCGADSSYKLRSLTEAAFDVPCDRASSKVETAYGRDPFYYPNVGGDLLHVVEDVHMQIFVSMLLYFFIMSQGITHAKHMCERWHWWEEHMHAYSRFPPDENRAGLRRMFRPLTDVKDFFKVKLFFVQWAQSGGLRHVEEKRARERARAANKYSRSPVPCGKLSAVPGAEVAGAEVGDDESFAGRRTRRDTVVEPVDSFGGISPAAHKPKGADVRINERFHFAEYLTFCFAELLEELIDFKPPTWGFVMLLSAIEVIAMWYGVKYITIDIAYTCLDVMIVLFMWMVAKVFSRDIIQAAEGGSGTASLGRGFAKISQNFHVEVHFLRVLQAITWRDIFRVSEFFLGPTFRSYVNEEGYFHANNGPTRVVIISVLIFAACLLPFISFDWGLAMFLPPHLDEGNVEVAELVCWRQKHPLESFTAPWEVGLDHIPTDDEHDSSTSASNHHADGGTGVASGVATRV